MLYNKVYVHPKNQKGIETVRKMLPHIEIVITEYAPLNDLVFVNSKSFNNIIFP
jgi:hypothetical protein